MSDTRLRELERRWRETGSPDDEAAYLLERVRVGDLTQERLELAAYCGHEGARRATVSAGPPPDWRAWALGLERWGPLIALRAYITAFKSVSLPKLSEDPVLKSTDYPAWAVECTGRLQAYLDHPTAEARDRLVEWDTRCQVVLTDTHQRLTTLVGDSAALLTAAKAALVAFALTASRKAEVVE